MTNACKNNGKLLEEILKREDISQLTAAENSHIMQCPHCKAELGKIVKIENKLKAYVNTSLASIPIRKFKLPVTEKPLPQVSMLQNVAEILKTWQFATGFAVVLIACCYLFFTGLKGPSSQPASEHTPNIVLSPSLETAPKSVTQQHGSAKETADGFLIVKSLQKFIFEGYSIETEDAIIKLQNQAARLRRGHILCKVTSGNSLTIFTSTAKIKVLGTEFEVAVYDNDETWVNVITGRVEVIQSNHRETLTLGAGQSAVVSSPPENFSHPARSTHDKHNKHYQNNSDEGFEKPSAKTLSDLLK